MARHIRALVTWRNTNEPPKNACSNTLYFQQDPEIALNWQAIADDVAEVYRQARDSVAPIQVRLLPEGWQINVRLYDMSDAEPRPIKAEATVAQTSPAETRPREVALCLSYYGDRNLPSMRGRVYLGPFTFTSLASRPTAAALTSIVELGKKLSEIGGEDISWRVHSPKTGEYHHIRTVWCDNEWDTVRRRQLDADARQQASV